TWILAAMGLDRGWASLIDLWALRRSLRPAAIARAASAGVGVLALAGYIFTSMDWSQAPLRWQAFASSPGRGAAGPTPGIPRWGPLGIPAGQRATLREVTTRLRKYAPPGQGLYVFSNEAVYYFLTDTVNPTRYAIAGFIWDPQRVAEVLGSLQ